MSDTATPSVPRVYYAISAVMADLSKNGITKSRKNASQGYNFRGIDDVYNALSAVLAEHRLVMLPRVLSRSCEERQTKSGGALFYVTVDVEYDIIAAEDGSRHVVRFVGEAMDSADKATNKAMSAAFKYMAMQTFCIPTEGDNDADSHTHEVGPRVQQPTPRPAPAEQHDPSWDKGRPAFCAALGEFGLKYDDVAAYFVAIGEGKPSTWPGTARRKLVDDFRGGHPILKQINDFVASTTPKAK